MNLTLTHSPFHKVTKPVRKDLDAGNTEGWLSTELIPGLHALETDDLANQSARCVPLKLHYGNPLLTIMETLFLNKLLLTNIIIQ